MNIDLYAAILIYQHSYMHALLHVTITNSIHVYQFYTFLTAYNCIIIMPSCSRIPQINSIRITEILKTLSIENIAYNCRSSYLLAEFY